MKSGHILDTRGVVLESVLASAELPHSWNRNRSGARTSGDGRSDDDAKSDSMGGVRAAGDCRGARRGRDVSGGGRGDDARSSNS